MALPDVITPDMIDYGDGNALPDVITPDMIDYETPSVTDRVLSIGKNAALNTVLAGSNLARAGNSAIEGAVNKLSEKFPETTQSIYDNTPQWIKDLSTGAYAPPTDAEYAATAKDLRGAIQDTTEKNAPKSGVGKYAYMAGQGLADLAPKMTMGPAGFAASAGAEGGLERFYSRTDEGVPAAEAAPYALAGGAVDAVVGYAMPKAIQSVLASGASSVKKVAGELATFAGFGVSQTAIESVLKKYLAGDENALKDAPQQVVDAILTAPLMMFGLKTVSMGARVGSELATRAGERLTRNKEIPGAKDLEAKMDALRAAAAAPRPEASSYAFVSSDGVPPAREPGRAGSRSFELQDASPETAMLNAMLKRHNEEVARYEMQQRDQRMVDNSRMDQRGTLPEAKVLGEEAPPASEVIVPESYGGGPRTLTDAYQMLQDLNGGTEVYNMKRGSYPKAPEETVGNPILDSTRELLERPRPPKGPTPEIQAVERAPEVLPEPVKTEAPLVESAPVESAKPVVTGEALRAELDAEMKSAKFKREEIQLTGPEGKKTPAIGESYGDFSVHKQEGTDKFVVTHKPTGLRTSTPKSKTEARKMAVRLANELDGVDLSKAAPGAKRDKALDAEMASVARWVGEVNNDPYAPRFNRAEVSKLSTGARKRNKLSTGARKRNKQLGAVVNPIGDAVVAVKNFIERVGKDKETDRAIQEGIKDGSIIDADSSLPPLEKMFRGDKVNSKPGQVRNEVARKASAAYHYYTTFVRTAAKKSAQVKQWYDTTSNELVVNHMTEGKLFTRLQPYINLLDDAKVNAFLLIQRRNASQGKAVVETDANLTKLGFTPEEISAIKSVRETMDSALEEYREAKIAEGGKPEEIDAKIKELKASHYVPFGRYGSYKVEATKGDERAVHFEETKELALKRSAELAKEGYTSTTTERVEPKDLPFKLPTELTEPAGFKKHLIPAKLTKGEGDNLKRAIGDYIVNLARLKGYSVTAAERAATFKELKDSNQMRTYEWLAKVNSDFHSPTHGLVKTVRNGMYLYYLRMNVGSALVNMTQPVTVTYPMLSKHTKNAGAKIVAGYKDVGEYIAKGKTSNPAINEMIERAKTEGLLGETINKDWLETARTGKGPSLLSRILPDLFSKAEYVNRLHALIVGGKAFAEKGITGEELYKQSIDFVKETQFDYGKINAPMMARGGMAAPFTFRLWTGNYLSLLGQSMNKQNYGVALRMLGAMGAIAGPLGGLPFIKELMAGIESLGYDPRGAIKDTVGESINDFLNYGAFAAIPLESRPNITSKAGLGELVQGIDKGNVLATAGRAFLGATADPLIRAEKAIKFAGDGNYGRALETMLPEGIPKAISKSIRIREKDPVTGEEMGFRTPSGEPIITDTRGKPVQLTGAEKVFTGIGLQPTRLTEAYKLQHSMQRTIDTRTKLGAEINSSIADALYEKNWDQLRSALQKAKDAGINVSSPSVRERIFKRLTGRELTQIKNAPKDIRDDLMRIYVDR